MLSVASAFSTVGSVASIASGLTLSAITSADRSIFEATQSCKTPLDDRQLRYKRRRLQKGDEDHISPQDSERQYKWQKRDMIEKEELRLDLMDLENTHLQHQANIFLQVCFIISYISHLLSYLRVMLYYINCLRFINYVSILLFAGHRLTIRNITKISTRSQAIYKQI